MTLYDYEVLGNVLEAHYERGKYRATTGTALSPRELARLVLNDLSDRGWHLVEETTS